MVTILAELHIGILLRGTLCTHTVVELHNHNLVPLEEISDPFYLMLVLFALLELLKALEVLLSVVV